jgi:hypothetical protein
MIEDTLNGVKSKRHRHAARHVLECQALSSSIEDYAAFETHDAFVERIGAKMAAKPDFGAVAPSSRHHPDHPPL